MTDILQIVGAVLVLSGFAASQLGRIGAKSVPYLTVNVVGACLLAWLALHDHDWGFLLLEGVWAVVSLISLCGVLRARHRAPVIVMTGGGGHGVRRDPPHRACPSAGR